MTDYRYDLSRTLKVLGDLLADSDRVEEATDLYGRAAAIAEKLAAEAPSVHYYRARQALVQLALGRLFEKTDKPNDARQPTSGQSASSIRSLRNIPMSGSTVRT